MKKLAPRVAHHAEKLGATPEQLPRLIEFLDPGGQCPEQGGQTPGPFLAVHLIMLCHGYLEGAARPPVKFKYYRLIKIIGPPTGVCTKWCKRLSCVGSRV